MEFTKFIRTPYVVEAVEITESNLEEVADIVGYKGVNGTSNPIKEKDGLIFIALDRKVVGPTLKRAYVGHWLARFEGKYRCYVPNIFEQQFVDHMDQAIFNFDQDGKVYHLDVNAGTPE